MCCRASSILAPTHQTSLVSSIIVLFQACPQLESHRFPVPCQGQASEVSGTPTRRLSLGVRLYQLGQDVRAWNSAQHTKGKTVMWPEVQPPRWHPAMGLQGKMGGLETQPRGVRPEDPWSAGLGARLCGRGSPGARGSGLGLNHDFGIYQPYDLG